MPCLCISDISDFMFDLNASGPMLMITNVANLANNVISFWQHDIGYNWRRP